MQFLEGEKMKELRSMVKNILIAQNGKFYGYNANNLRAIGYKSEDIQKAYNYFMYSVQQRSFRDSLREGSE